MTGAFVFRKLNVQTYFLVPSRIQFRKQVISFAKVEVFIAPTEVLGNSQTFQEVEVQIY